MSGREPATETPAADPRPGLAADGTLTVADAVAFSGIGRCALYALMRSGVLPYALTAGGGRRLLSRRGLVEYLAGLEWTNVPEHQS